MNHSYIAGLTDNLCRTCKRDEYDHSNNAICEACINIGPCELSGNILLCKECYAKVAIPATINNIALNATNVAELTPEASIANNPTISYGPAIDVAVTISPYSLQDLPINGNEFFNAQTIAIKELETYIINDTDIPADQKRFKLVQQLQARYSRLKEACFKATELILETKSGMASIQVGLNELAGKLRAEERAILKIEHIDYQPSVPKAPKAIKMSKADQSIQGYASLMGITFEHAKRLLAQTMKEAHEAMGNKCSCQSTPGICKIHHP